MTPAKAAERQRSIAQSQTTRAQLGDLSQPLPIEAIRKTQIEDGVPPRYAGLIRGDLDGGAHKAAGSAIECFSIYGGPGTYEGLAVYSNDPHYGARIAGAVYTGAMVRGQGAKWYEFPDMAHGFGQKITIDKNQEWDVGELQTWMTELDSSKYCYGLLVINTVRAQLVTNFVGSELYKVVSARSVRGLFTVLVMRDDEAQTAWSAAPAMADHIDGWFLKHKETPGGGK